jgi:hypothetical protein
MFQIEEAIIRYGLMRSSAENFKIFNPSKKTEKSEKPEESKEPEYTDASKDWLVDKWKFFKNPSETDKITSKNMIEFKETGITTCVRRVYFDSQLLSSSVDTLDEETLYVSTKHNGVLFDCMYVNKDLKVVFMFNVTSKQPSDHPLKPTTVENVKKIMKITENGFRIRLFYCVSSKMKIKKRIRNIDGIDIFIAKVKFLACDKDVI